MIENGENGNIKIIEIMQNLLARRFLDGKQSAD